MDSLNLNVQTTEKGKRKKFTLVFTVFYVLQGKCYTLNLYMISGNKTRIMSGDSSLAHIVDGEASESDDDTITSGHSSPEHRYRWWRSIIIGWWYYY